MVNDGLLLLLALMTLLLVMCLYAVITLSPQDAARTEPSVLNLPAPAPPSPASPWLPTAAAPPAAAGQPGHTASPAWHLDALPPAPSAVPRQAAAGTSAKAATPRGRSQLTPPAQRHRPAHSCHTALAPPRPSQRRTPVRAQDGAASLATGCPRDRRLGIRSPRLWHHSAGCMIGPGQHGSRQRCHPVPPLTGPPRSR